MTDDATPAAPLVLDAVALTLPSAAGPVNILRGVDLVVNPGERVAIIGPSGSGKSSLIAVGAGLEEPTAGQVRLFGQDLAKLNEDGRARLRRGRAALVFQSFHLLPNMTAEENVAAPMEIARKTRDAMADRARLACDRVGLGAARPTHYPHQLSGGEQQRVALAQGVGPPPLPCSSPTSRRETWTPATRGICRRSLDVEPGGARGRRGAASRDPRPRALAARARAGRDAWPMDGSLRWRPLDAALACGSPRGNCEAGVQAASASSWPVWRWAWRRSPPPARRPRPSARA